MSLSVLEKDGERQLTNSLCGQILDKTMTKLVMCTISTFFLVDTTKEYRIETDGGQNDYFENEDSIRAYVSLMTLYDRHLANFIAGDSFETEIGQILFSV
jgi:hypothetical protein